MHLLRRRRIRFIFLLIILGILSFAACKEAPKTAVKTQNGSFLPPLPAEFHNDLLARGEALDFVFHELPFSVNQEDVNSVRSSLSGFGTTGVNMNNCPAIGRVFIQSKGDIIAEAEIHYAPNDCGYYIFYNGNTPLYVSKMLESSLAFYQSLIGNLENIETGKK